MKIMVKTKGEEGERGFAFSIHLPLALIKSNFIWNQIVDKTAKDTIPTKVPGKEIYKVLKSWVRENGHLTLVDIDTKDTKVRIVI